MASRILIADDQPVVCEGLTRFFQDCDIEILECLHDGTKLAERAKELQPDLVLLEIKMPSQTGLQAMEELKNAVPNTRVVVYSSQDNPTFVARSLALGAVDYIPKTSPRSYVVDAVQRALRGEQPPAESPTVGVRASMSRKREIGDEGIPLTNRELQVLRHIALGLSNREIGQSLNISIETVKEHVQNILRKLDTPDRTAAAVWAVKRGLV